MSKLDTSGNRRQYTRPPFRVQDILDTFDYCPETGNLYYKDTQDIVVAQGKRDGMFTRIGDKLIAVHRLCWCVHYREWPAFKLRHLNKDRTDNRAANLARDVWANDPGRQSAASTTAKPGW